MTKRKGESTQPTSPLPVQSLVARPSVGPAELPSPADGRPGADRRMEQAGPDPVRRCPYRSPRAVADAIRGVIENRTVCDVGCAEGDMMAAMARYARQVIGFDMDPRRYGVAKRRGFRVVAGNYHLDPLPEADVYYFWPDHGARDDRFLIDKLQGRASTIIVGGDSNVPSEVQAVTECAARGRLVRVPFDEGSGYRQRGEFLLAIIDTNIDASSPGVPPSGDRRAVVSMAIGDCFGALAALSMPGQMAYARRLGADHIVLREPLLSAHSPFYEIFQLHRLFDDYARILYLDLDVLVRDDCPDLFAQVPSDALGVFFESRLVDRAAEIQSVQSLWPALGWTGDYFNNGVMVASRAHRDLFAPDFTFPRDLRFADQTVMNYRAMAGGYRLHDLGFGFNYMPAILPRGPLLRFCLNHIGNGLWPVSRLYQALPEPENAHVLHCAGFPYPIKMRLAQRTLALWGHRRGRGFTASHRGLNRVFGTLVPRPGPGVALGCAPEHPILRAPSGRARPLDQVEASLWHLCDGTSTADQIVRRAGALLPGYSPALLRQSVHRNLHALLDRGYLEAANQIEPIFAGQEPGALA